MTLLTRDPIDLAGLSDVTPADGALCLFVGVVRRENQGRRVLYLEYEAYEDMALAMLRDLVEETRGRWPVTQVRAVHRLGRLEIGEASVAVAVSSPHRADAFAACRHLIDRLKKTLPIWKKEFFEGGSVWIEAPHA